MSRGVLSSATRTSRIERWLDTHKRIDKANTLKLEVQSGDEGIDVIATWEHDAEWSSARVASEVDACVQNLADENGSRVTARLVWITGAGETWTAFPLRADPAQGATNLDGSHRSQAVQSQAHLQAMGRMYMEKMESMEHQSNAMHEGTRKLMESMSNALLAVHERNHQMMQRFDELMGENSELRARTVEAEEGANRAADVAEEAAKVVEDLKAEKSDDGQVVQLVSKMLMSHNSAKKA